MRISLASALVVCITVTLLTVQSASAQVFNLGPSDSALFDLVLNVPPDVPPTTASGSTQVNVGGTGSLPPNFEANAGSEINLQTGGSLGNPFRANAGSEVNIFGGGLSSLFAGSGSVVSFLGNGFSNGVVVAEPESTVNIAGPFQFRRLDALSNSQVNLFGTEFLLSRDSSDPFGELVPIEGLQVGVPRIIDMRDVVLESVFTGGETATLFLNRFFSPEATITVTVVPEASSFALLGFAAYGLLTGGRRGLV